MENEVSFHSDFSNLTIAENLIDEVSAKFHISRELYGNILISVLEAVNNAITHGNKLDSTKYVTIKYRKEKSILSFIVIDQGCGFDYNNLPDPTTPENLEKITGRGIFLMTQLADEVHFYEKGTQVEIRFNLK